MEYIEIVLMFLKAFAVGGLICTAAQVVINLTDLTSGKILVLFMLIGIGLTALGLYQPNSRARGRRYPSAGSGICLQTAR